MKKVTIETNYKALQEIAKLFDLKAVGVKAETLVEEINAKIDEMKAPAKKGKWYENETPAFAEGDMALVKSGWAVGRRVTIVKPSAKKNAFKAQLLSPKDGALQGTLVTVDECDLELYIPQLPAILPEAL